MSWRDLFHEMAEAAAVLLYGALSILLLFAFAVWRGSVPGACFAVLCAGLTYVYQEAQRHYGGQAVRVLFALPLIAWLAALAAATFGV